MEAFEDFLRSLLGTFVRDDGGVYKGQCPQLPKHVVVSCGGTWTGNTGHGKDTTRRVIENGGYEGASHLGYRFASCDVAGSPYGHTWVEVNRGGKWVIYEQNINRAGTKRADFGVGSVYSVSFTETPGNWRQNVRYAGHPNVDRWIEQHQPQKKSNEEIAQEVINGVWGNGQERINRLTAAGYDYNAIQAIVNEKMAKPAGGATGEVTYTVQPGDQFGQIIINLGLNSGAGLWGPNGDVAYYAKQVGLQNPNLIYPGQTFTFTKRS